MINNDELHSVNKFEALYKVAKSTDNVKVMKYARNQLVMLYAELGDEINQQRVSRW